MFSRGRALAPVVAVALLFTGIAGHSPEAAEPGGWTLPQLTVTDGTITDVTGRTVLLRGANVNQLNDYAQNDQPLPTVAPLDDTDFAHLAALGFNVVRLNLAWSALEPTPGAFDRNYVARIHTAVDAAKAHGIYTVLDMHQDAWGKAVGTPVGQGCPILMQPGIGWDGAPAWATLTDGWTTCNFGGVRETAPAVARAFQNFYDDTQSIQGHLVNTWAKLAAEFAAEPAIAGYDLLNEPNPGLRDPFSAADQLGRYYRRVIAAIRQAEQGHPPHLAIFEPSAIWSAVGVDATPPPKYIDDPLAVFSPHLYSESINIVNAFPTIEAGFAIARDVAAKYRVPLWTGEWGWFGDPNSDAAEVDRFMDQLDANRMGGAWWSWKQGCGDPHSVRDGNSGRVNGNLNRIDCPSGRELGEAPGFARPLARAFPRAAPGRLTTVTTAGFTGTGSGRLEAWYPGDARPNLQSANISDLTLTQIPGGWQLTGNTAGSYSVEQS